MHYSPVELDVEPVVQKRGYVFSEQAIGQPLGCSRSLGADLRWMLILQALYRVLSIPSAKSFSPRSVLYNYVINNLRGQTVQMAHRTHSVVEKDLVVLERPAIWLEAQNSSAFAGSG